MSKRLFVLIIMFLVFGVMKVSATPKFCSECGTALTEGSKFCSGCGVSIEGNIAKQKEESVKDKIESLFAPVDEFTIYLGNSNFATCIAKYPEYIIRMNNNRKEIDSIVCDSVTRKVIQCYFSHWDILCDLMEKWNQNKSLEYEYRCKTRLAHIAKVKEIWKKGGTLADIEKAEAAYEKASRVFTVANTQFLAVKERSACNHQIRAEKGARFIIASVYNDEAAIMFIDGYIHAIAPLNPDEYVENKFTSVFHVDKNDLIKRSTCSEEDVKYFER